MMARRKLDVVEIAEHNSLAKRIVRTKVDKSIAAIIEKDRHLIEAALATDKRLASLDDTVRQHLSQPRHYATGGALDLLGKPEHARRGSHCMARIRRTRREIPDSRTHTTQVKEVKDTNRPRLHFPPFSSHHQSRGSAFFSGHTRSSVSPSYISPFFIT